jgi:hypothetical protein
MKTKVLLLGAVVTAFAITSFAAAPLLSPRAKDNQIKIMKSAVEAPAAVAYVDASPALLSPRANDNQIKVVKGAFVDVNPALECRKDMIGSPRVVAECSSHTTMPGCMTVAAVK